MRIRATRRVQAGAASVEWECDIECTPGELFHDHISSVIHDTLFKDVETAEIVSAANPSPASVEG